MTFGRRLVTLLLLALSSIEAQVNRRRRPWINEFHYENKGDDVNEFIEIAAPAGFDIKSWQLILYNGFYGRVYEEDAYHPLVTFEKGETLNGIDFYYLPIKPQNCSAASSWCGLENGKDGFALANYFTATSGRVVELLSYEGTFFAKDGPATNMTSMDIGVMQTTTTPLGHSIAKIGTGCDPNDFYWANVDRSTVGTVNTNQTITCSVGFINEIHYNDVNGGEGQFVEVASNVIDPAAFTLELYSGVDGQPYDTIGLDEFQVGETTEDGLTFYYYEFPSGGASTGLIVDTSPATAVGLALVKFKKNVVEFLSYGGEFVAQGGYAQSMTSVDIGVEEDDATPVGSSLQLVGVGCVSEDFLWVAVKANQVDINPTGSTPGKANVGQDIDCVVEVPEPEPEILNDDVAWGVDDFLDDDAAVMVSTDGEELTVGYEMERRDPTPIK